MGALTFQKLFFNKYTGILAAAIAIYFTFNIMSNKIENLEKSLEVKTADVVKLKDELVKTNEILSKQEEELLEQVDNILILEIDKQKLKQDLQKTIEKRNKKDVSNIIVKKTKLTEITVNRFIKKKIGKYNNREGVK